MSFQFSLARSLEKTTYKVRAFLTFQFSLARSLWCMKSRGCPSTYILSILSCEITSLKGEFELVEEISFQFSLARSRLLIRLDYFLPKIWTFNSLLRDHHPHLFWYRAILWDSFNSLLRDHSYGFCKKTRCGNSTFQFSLARSRYGTTQGSGSRNAFNSLLRDHLLEFVRFVEVCEKWLSILSCEIT
mgnify:CR=1 FL=1